MNAPAKGGTRSYGAFQLFHVDYQTRPGTSPSALHEEAACLVDHSKAAVAHLMSYLRDKIFAERDRGGTPGNEEIRINAEELYGALVCAWTNLEMADGALAVANQMDLDAGSKQLPSETA